MHDRQQWTVVYIGVVQNAAIFMSQRDSHCVTLFLPFVNDFGASH